MLKLRPILFNDFINNRTTEIHDRLLLRDREQYQLFLEYECAENDMNNREDEVIYRQGLVDGIKLKALIP